jgi:hypothetical protein
MPMSMAECVFPEDTSKLISITDGTRWFYNVIPNSIRVDHARNAVSFLYTWYYKGNGQVRSTTLRLDAIKGYEQSA